MDYCLWVKWRYSPTRRMMDALKLISILLEKDLSLSLFDELWKWKHPRNNFVARGKQYSLNKIVQVMSNQIYGQTLSTQMIPHIILHRLPSGRSCRVVKFDIPSLIYDMLNNQELTTEENMKI